ncbi:hypothetical protein [Trueperella sp. LYQ143]|uniref:hypothetical protein n=1 Tax=Trueperella sp. LYQ143 TaxID=3391059 RepID=UPI003982D9C9
MIPALAGVLGSRIARAVCDRRDLTSWKRKSYSGKQVCLSGGLDLLAGVTAANCAGSFAQPRYRAACLLATGSAGLAGYIDDHCEDRFPAHGKGFRGHLGALRRGQLSSGAAKIAIIGTGAMMSAAWLEVCGLSGSNRPNGARDLRVRFASGLVNTAIIALSANTFNLLDLRPGRARKVAILLGVPTGGQVGRDTAVAAAAGIGEDLLGRTMLGDLGANVLGAQLGMGWTRSSLPVRCVTLAVLLGVNVAAERVSFSQLIESTPVLREFDMLGR